MNITPSTSPERLEQTWKACYNTYLRHGKRLRFPAGTDRTKTYMWRYLHWLSQKLEQWQLDPTTAKKLIEVAVQHQHQNGLLAKGLAVLCQHNLLQLCHKQLLKERTHTSIELQELAQSVQWARTHNVRSLLHRPHPDAYCCLVQAYQTGQVSRLWLALSPLARTVLPRLSPAERALLPTPAQLYLLRIGCHQDPGFWHSAQDLLCEAVS